ncbi:unnamed protein product [Prorocentrum cordatum]|uniref:DNA-directed DNA polymerase n=1 Tax=Prorocentrum cordatum TaxID=2364126 RepID=A0ABN9QKK1_9DINO|nr:unnamed protein product [Polarella glacialis]
MLADLAKCYEKVAHQRMWWLAAWWNGPLHVVALDMESFAFGKVTRIGEACPAAVCAAKGVNGKCSFLQTSSPSAALVNPVDMRGVPLSTSDRWLGIDCGPQAAATNASAPVRRGRFALPRRGGLW